MEREQDQQVNLKAGMTQMLVQFHDSVGGWPPGLAVLRFSRLYLQPRGEIRKEKQRKRGR